MTRAREPNLDPDRHLPVLPGWISLTEAGEWLGCSRQHAYRMAREGKFTSLHRIGTAHQFVVTEDELRLLARDRENAPIR
jgi:hypothetical protein